METTKAEALSRITIDIPSDQHTKLKILAASQQISMRKILLKIIDQILLENESGTKKQ